eukprot:g8047.t1
MDAASEQHHDGLLSCVYFVALLIIPLATIIQALLPVSTAAAPSAQMVRQRVKRCVVQLGVHDGQENQLKNIGSGALLKGGYILTAAHNLLDMEFRPLDPHAPPHAQRPSLVTGPHRTVLIAEFSDADKPPQWAYEAEVLTPLALLRRTGIQAHQLLDLAILRVKCKVVCEPAMSRGAGHVTDPDPDQRKLAVIERRALTHALPFLECSDKVDEGDAVSIFAYAAGTGSKNIY